MIVKRKKAPSIPGATGAMIAFLVMAIGLRTTRLLASEAHPKLPFSDTPAASTKIDSIAESSNQLSPDNPCVKMNLSEAQKGAIQEKLAEFARKAPKKEAGIRSAMVSKDLALSSATSSKSEAAALQAMLSHAVEDRDKDAAELELSIDYDILRPDQRGNALLCTQFLRGQSGNSSGLKDPVRRDGASKNP